MRRTAIHKFFAKIIIAAAVLLSVSPVTAGSGEVGIIVSRKIKPYMQMVQGVKQTLDHSHTLLFLNENRDLVDKSGRGIQDSIESFSLLLAVGPQALSKTASAGGAVPVVYGMVLKPGTVGGNTDMTGVSLNVFSRSMLKTVAGILPDIKNIAVLYNPDNDSRSFVTDLSEGDGDAVMVTPLRVRTRSDIAKVLDTSRPGVDSLLFVPDPTVVSKKLVKYIIKQEIYKGKPVIGYNRFFHESGAAVSIVIDYEKTGERAGIMVNRTLDGESVRPAGPDYDIWLNQKVIDLLNLEVREPLPENVVYK